MPPVISFPDPVVIVLRFLVQQLLNLGHPVPMGTKIPNPRPPEFVLVRRVGGSRQNFVVDAARLAIEAWSTTPGDAADLAEQCRALVLSMQGTVQSSIPIYQVIDVGGPGDLPDPLSDQPRYSFAVEMHIRGGVRTALIADEIVITDEFGNPFVDEDGNVLIWA